MNCNHLAVEDEEPRCLCGHADSEHSDLARLLDTMVLARGRACHQCDVEQCADFRWAGLPNARVRRCLLCGVADNRSAHLATLGHAIRERHRLPPSPWSAEEAAAEIS